MKAALPLALYCAAAWLIANSTSIAQTSGRNDKIALTGETAPSGLPFSGFAPPALNNSNQVAFGADTPGRPNSGIYLGTVAGVKSVAVQGAAAPGGGVFESLTPSPVINDAGQVAFLSTINNALNDPYSGVYVGTGSALDAVALTGSPAPGGGNFTGFYNPAINSHGDTVFVADATGERSSGMHFVSGGVVSAVALQGRSAPGTPGLFASFSESRLNAAGETAWVSVTAQFADTSVGVYRGSTSGVSSIAQRYGSAPDGGTYLSFGLPDINDSGDTLFYAGVKNGPSGIYLRTTSGVSAVALEGANAPGGRAFTSRFNGEVDLNNAAQAVFSATTSDGLTGVYLGTTSAVRRVAFQTADAPGGGVFSSFSNLMLNEGGNVLFSADLTNGGQGIYLGDGIDLVKAIATENELAGSTVTAVALASGAAFGQSAINDLGQVAYRAFLANGKSGVFLFTPALHWRVAVNGQWNTAGHWTLGIAPAAVHDVLIEPATTLTVSGPSDNVTVRSLQVGGGAGTATLNLLPNVTLTAPGGVAITATGVLSGRGTIAAKVSNSGRINPGTSPGLLTITGDFTQADSGRLEMELGGLAPGTEHDKLAVSGNVALAGTLDVTLFAAFTPAGGDRFDLIDWTSESGVFSTLNLPALDGGLSWDTSNLYTDGTLLVVPEPSASAVVLSAVALLATRRRQRDDTR